MQSKIDKYTKNTQLAVIVLEEDIINSQGFNCTATGGVTKDTKLLIVLDKSSNSTKIKNAIKYNIPIMTPDEFMQAYNINITKF